MCVDLLSFNDEHDICELRVVDNFTHVLDQAIDGLIVDFVFFQFADIQNANVVEPLAPVKASENK